MADQQNNMYWFYRDHQTGAIRLSYANSEIVGTLFKELNLNQIEQVRKELVDSIQKKTRFRFTWNYGFIFAYKNECHITLDEPYPCPYYVVVGKGTVWLRSRFFVKMLDAYIAECKKDE